MKTVSKMVIMVLVGLPMLMTVGCKKEMPNSSNVRFNLTDAPGDYEAVIVDIKGVEVNTETQGWVTIQSDLGKVNLLDYMNGKTTLLAEGQIAAGKITQVRLILGSENSIIADGKTFMLQTPSAMQNGLKLNVNNTLQAGSNYEWTIDFDAAQSVVATGAGSFILKPSLRLIVDAKSTIDAAVDGNSSTGGNIDVGVNTGGGIEAGTGINVGGGTSVNTGGSANTSGNVVVKNEAGNIVGKVSLTGGLAVAYATDAAGKVTSTLTAVDGSFKFQSLAQGNYNLKIEPLLPLFSVKTLSNIKVAAEQTTDVGTIMM